MADSEKSFSDKLLGFFIKEDPAAPKPAPTQTVPPAPSPGFGGVVSKPATTPSGTLPGTAAATHTGTVSGTVDTKFVDHFAGVLSKTNLQGPDYFEFREIVRNLENLGLPEEKQFQAAWASFKAMAGVGDPGMLATAANQYMAALRTDREAFLGSVETAMTERVGGLQTEQKQLVAENEAISKQMADLQQRAAQNADRLSQIDGEVTAQTAKISQNKANFEASYASFTEQISADITKIAAYLK